MKPVNQSQELFKGALILTIGALLTKILSAIYRIPFQNIVGDIGFYIYQQVYPFIGLALILSTSGFPVVISKLYGEQVHKKDLLGVQRLIMSAAFVLTAFGVAAFALLYFGAGWLALKMNDPQLAPLFKIISVVYLLFPFISLLRGLYQGEGNMVPTAVSQVGEQLTRVLTILITSTLLIKSGFSLYLVGGGAVFGSITGGIIALIVLLSYVWRKGGGLASISLPRHFDKENKKIMKDLVFQGFAVCISSMLLIFIQLADALNLYSLLIESGIKMEEAKKLKGIYDRGQPLIQLGMVVATSMSLSLVPLLSREKFKVKRTFLMEKIRLSLLISLTFGVGAAVGLWSIIEPTNIMLYKNAEGTEVLAQLSFIILLSSLIITISAILQGLGFLKLPAFMILFGFGIKYVFNLLLVPSFGTAGAAIASNMTLLLILMILYLRLRVIMGGYILKKRTFLVFLVASFCMSMGLRGYLFITGSFYDFGSERITATLQAVTGVVLGGIIYLFIIFRGKLLSQSDLALLPFGSKLMFLLPKKNGR